MSGVSLYPYPMTRGREFLRVGELPRSPWCRGLEYMSDFDGGDRAAIALYICSVPLYTMETRTTPSVQLCMQQKYHIGATES